MCDPSAVCSKTACPRHMSKVVTRAMLRRPLESWPVTCQIACPKGPLSLEAVGHLLGCTRERARQIEEKALAQLLVAARKRYRGCKGAADFIGTGDGA